MSHSSYLDHLDKDYEPHSPVPSNAPILGALPAPTVTQSPSDDTVLKGSWRDLFSFTRKAHTLPLVAALISAAFVAGLKTVLAVFLGEIFELIADFGSGNRSGSESLSSVTRWSIILVGVGAGNWLAHVAFLSLWVIFGELQATSVRQSVFKSLVSRDMAWFDSQEQGISSLLVRIQTQTRELQLATSQVFGILVIDILTSSASLGVAFYYSWKLTLVLLATLPISALILSLATRPVQPAIQRQRRELATASKQATASITAIDLVKVFHGYDQDVRRYMQATLFAANQYLIQARCNSIQIGYVGFWVIAMFVVGFAYGTALVNNGLEAGHVITTFYATLASFQGFEALMPHWLVLAKGMSAGKFLASIAGSCENMRAIKTTHGSFRPRECAGDVELANVSFSYPSNPSTKVLEPSSFFFPAGEFTFIVGKSGSGKSTLGSLISNLYQPLTGEVQIDGRSSRVLDPEWLRSNVLVVQQSNVVFNETFFANVALGAQEPEKVTQQEVLRACEFALLQSTLDSLSDGLETLLGAGGSNLSGGQKQRLALARAYLRNPVILVLDEITSGLDQATRSHIMDRLRQWRRGKTTVVITHDISQINGTDFVYVMNEGRVVQEGLRRDLMRQHGGLFASLATTAKNVSPINTTIDINVVTPGSPETPESAVPEMVPGRFSRFSRLLFDGLESNSVTPSRHGLSRRSSLVSGSGFVFRAQESSQISAPRRQQYELAPYVREEVDQERHRFSRWVSSRFLLGDESEGQRPLELTRLTSRRQSRIVRKGLPQPSTIAKRGSACVEMPPPVYEQTERARQDNPNNGCDPTVNDPVHRKHQFQQDSLVKILKTVWPTLTLRDKLTLLLGIIACVIGAAAMPAFAYCYSKMLAALWSTGDKIAEGGKWAIILTFIAILDGLGTGGGRYLLERVGQAWVNSVRVEALKRILRQPKPWFERSKNSPGRISECLDRNAEEMRNIVGKFVPITASVVIMISISVIWAFCTSWKLTLVALAPLPAVLAAVKGYAIVSGRFEAKCNNGAEDASAVLTEILLNIRVVRAFTLESHFSAKYERLVAGTLGLGYRRAGYSSPIFGIYQSMNYGMTALIFYYGTLLAERQEATISQVLQVVNLLLFSIGTSAGILSSIPQLVMAQATATQMLDYARLPLDPPEEQRGPVQLACPLPVKMERLNFSYPARGRRGNVLRQVSLEIRPGECTTLVGSSGCGKSTVVSLILGLYSPTIGDDPRALATPLRFCGVPYTEVDMRHLRYSMAYVPQTPFLFPATIAENIAYGLPVDSPHRSIWSITHASQAAGLHDFVVSLPSGYDTIVGDGGQALSGGQAQRLCIARALVRQPRLLVLDEPTSALDTESADVIRQTIAESMKQARGWHRDTAIVMVTHSREMMEVADKIIVMDEGRRVEEGEYEQLLRAGGAFAQLVSDGHCRSEGTLGGGSR